MANVRERDEFSVPDRYSLSNREGYEILWEIRGMQMTIANEAFIADGCQSALARVREEFVCWSRMQAEAGQPLDTIIARKELERRAGEGMFLWGVGNAPAVVTKVLAKSRHPVEVIFSIMKTRPKAADVAPSRTLLWRKYLDVNMVERPLPSHVIVTSRGGNEPGSKKYHFALVCYSNTPLRIERGAPFDPAAYRNAGGTQAPVGASQVTALLKRVGRGSDTSDYEANMKATLVEDYWVRLTDPMEMSRVQIEALSEASTHGLQHWLDFARELGADRRQAEYSRTQHLLF
jgi:hypothetical protein